jgi:hypothetical protein
MRAALPGAEGDLAERRSARRRRRGRDGRRQHGRSQRRHSRDGSGRHPHRAGLHTFLGPADSGLAGVATDLAFAGVLNLAWALGATVGLPRALTAQRTFSSHVVNFVDGATIAAAATGVLMMVRWPGRRTPFWLPLSAAWVGSGFLFGWGLWGLINVLGDTALVRNRPGTTSWLNLSAWSNSSQGWSSD